MIQTITVLEELNQLKSTKKISSLKRLKKHLDETVHVLVNENPLIRPYDEQGFPGGLVLLKPDLPVVVVPDLHARREFLYRVVTWPTPDGRMLLDRLAEHSIQLLCLGDGFHSEKRGYTRWIESFAEFQDNYRRHKHMDREMCESFGLMEMVMILKHSFPNNFHFLKGNHENIRNEEGGGNHPFGKFVYEGEMVKQWVLRFLGESFMDDYAEFEYLLPYMAVGKNFMASHAEPLEYYDPEDIINIQDDDGIKHGLTWTQNDRSIPGTVQLFLEHYSRRFERPLDYYLGGHRTIAGKYNLRAEGYFIQIHNPDKMQIFYSDPDKKPEPDRDIIDIEEEGVLKDE